MTTITITDPRAVEAEQAAFENWCPYSGSPDPRIVWAAAWAATLAATTQSAGEPVASGWIPVSDRMPQSGRDVLGFFRYQGKGKGRVVRVMWAAKFKCSEDDFGEFMNDGAEHDEETDMTYWPEGWYESNEAEETSWRLHEEITHWQELPPAPQLGAKPVAEQPNTSAPEPIGYVSPAMIRHLNMSAELLRQSGIKPLEAASIVRKEDAQLQDHPDLSELDVPVYLEQPNTDALQAALESFSSIQRYGLDTLSGRTDGPDDRAWQRQAVNEMTKRARLGAEAIRAQLGEKS